MQIEPTKLNRIAYKGKYENMRNMFIIALTVWLFTMGFLFSTARANIRMQQELMALDGGAKLVIVK
jgi:hypothetical protein